MTSTPEITIHNVEHLIPIQVNCSIDGREASVQAFIDYSTRQVYLSPESEALVGDRDRFVRSLDEWQSERNRQASREAESRFPTRHA